MKNKKKNILIISICSAIILLSILLTLLIINPFMSDKSKVTLGFIKTFGPESIFAIMAGDEHKNTKAALYPDYYTILASDAKNIATIYSGNFESNSRIKLENIQSADSSNLQYLKGAALSSTLIIDRDTKEAALDYEARYAGISIDVMDIYFDDNEMYLAVPELFDGYLSINTEKLVQDYNSSSLSEYSGEKIPEELKDYLSFNFFDTPEIMNFKNSPWSLKEFLSSSDATDALFDLYAAIEIEKTGDYELLSVGGRENRCKEYEIVIPKKAYKNFAQDYIDWSCEIYRDFLTEYQEYFLSAYLVEFNYDNFFSDDFIDDVINEYQNAMEEILLFDGIIRDYRFYAYLDRKGRLVKLTYKENFVFDDENYKVNASLAMLGKDSLADELEAAFTVKSEYGNLDFKLTNEASINENSREDDSVLHVKVDDLEILTAKLTTSYYYESNELESVFDMNIENDVRLASGLHITIEKNAKKDDYTIYLDELRYAFDSYYSESGSIVLSGEYSICALNDDCPMPKGHKYDIFKLSRDELLNLVNDIKRNAQNSFLFSLFL